MATSQGFWSYVHLDDQAEGERISRLARDVSAQFEMITGEKISLFLDRDAIAWGENWRDKVDENLASIAFFIPVLTPRFFLSAECRRELQFFARRATRLGIGELVLPLLYVDVPTLHDERPSDDLIQLVRTFQWEDWRQLRFADALSAEYRRAVAVLAARLVEANKQAEVADSVAIAARLNGDSLPVQDESPGVLDRMAQAEDKLPKWVESIQSIGRDIELIGQVMQQATADMNASAAGGFQARLIVARRVARQLAEPAERICVSGNEFTTHLHDVDQGFRAIIARAPIEARDDPASRAGFCNFFTAIRTMAAASCEGLASVQGMIDAIAPVEGMSRDLRPALRRLRQGLTMMVEAREVMDEWVRLVKASGMACDDVELGAH